MTASHPAPAPAFALPQGFSSLAEARAFFDAMDRAAPDLERLHAIASCMFLADALAAHPIAARMKLMNDTSGGREARMSFEMLLPDGEFMDVGSVSYALWDFRAASRNGGRYDFDSLPEFSDRMGKLFPDADLDKFEETRDACEDALFAALDALLIKAPSYARKAIDRGYTGVWISQGATARDVALALGLPEIASALESFDLQASTAAGAAAGRGPTL